MHLLFPQVGYLVYLIIAILGLVGLSKNFATGCQDGNQAIAGNQAIVEEEPFEPTPKNIEERLVRGELKTGIPFAFLPKKTRGSTVHMTLNLRFGDEKSLMGKAAACGILGSFMERGTKALTLQQLNDRKAQLKASISIHTKPQELRVSVATTKDTLVEVLDLLQELLRSPAFEEKELSVLKDQAFAQLENQKRDPVILVKKNVDRILHPYKRGDVRYIPTVDEEIEDYRNLKLSEIKEIHSKFLSGTEGEVTVVGDFDTKGVEDKLSLMLADWKSKIAYQRIAASATTDVKIPQQAIETPDKPASHYFASQQYAIRDDHPKYPALIIGNKILGGGALASRLGNRLRQNEGLSKGINSTFSASPIDELATLSIDANSNPMSMDKLVKVIDEEIRRLVKEGVSEKELKENIQGFLQDRRLSLSKDDELATILVGNLFAGRSMEYYEKLESEVARLTVEDVNEAIGEYISPERFVIAIAGDFAKPTNPK